MAGRILHVGITVSCLERSVAFYRDLLGLRYLGEILMRGDETDQLFGFKNADARIAYLNGSDEIIAPPLEIIQFLHHKSTPVTADLKRIGISEVCFAVQDIDKKYREMKEKGVNFLSRPQTFHFQEQGFSSSKAVYFKDPDNLIMELIEEI